MPVWLDAEAVKTLHKVALYEGDETGLNPGSDLKGALDRPKTHYYYEGVRSLPKLAALYGVAVAKAHAFRDGNKRTSLLAVDAFLDQNDVRFQLKGATGRAEPVFSAVAQSEIGYQELAAWIETHTARPGYSSSFSAYWQSIRSLFPTSRPRKPIRDLVNELKRRLGS